MVVGNAGNIHFKRKNNVMTRMRSGLAAVLTGLLSVALVVTGVVLADHHNGHHNDTCPGDVDGGGVAGVTVLLAVLADWGECPDYPDPCDADLDGDGSVGVMDLLEVLENWKEECCQDHGGHGDDCP